MKRISILICCCIYFIDFASASERDSVRQYYYHINLAELCIVDSNFSEARSEYLAAFKYKYPAPRDIGNAFMIAYLLSDTVMAAHCFNRLIEMGYRRENLEECHPYKLIKEDMLYLNLVSREDYFSKKYRMSAKPHFARILDSLVAVDQFYRLYTKPDSAILNDSLIAAYMCRLDEEHGFLGYQLAGAEDSGLPMCENALFLIFWHTRKTPSPLDSLYKKAVLDGFYDPSNYALVMDTKKIRYGAWIINGWLPREPQVTSFNNLLKDSTTVSYINKARAEIYLEPLEDYLRKMNYFYATRKTGLFYFKGLNMEAKNRYYFLRGEPMY